MKHIAQATKNRKVNAFVETVRAAVKQQRRAYNCNFGVKVGNAYRSATGDRFEIKCGRDVVLVELNTADATLIVTAIERHRSGSVTMQKPVVARNHRAFVRAMEEVDVWLS